MDDKQIMALLRLHFATRVVSVTLDGSSHESELVIGYFDRGGNYHCEAIAPNGTFRTIE